MSKEKLPTINLLGKKLLKHKRALMAIIIASGLVAAVRPLLRRYFSVPASCDSPCPDGRGCDPIEFSFEVAPKKLSLKSRDDLWYRARIKNRSCQNMVGIDVDGIVDDNYADTMKGLWITVIGPDGKKVPRRPTPKPDGGISWVYGSSFGSVVSSKGAIYPYQPNYENIKKLYDSKVLGEYDTTDLAPGQEFSTLSPVLKPYRLVAASWRSEDGGIVDGYKRVEVKEPSAFPPPPEGFKLLNLFMIDRPGVYKIKAGITAYSEMQPIFKRWENRSWLLFPIDWGLHPDYMSSYHGVTLTREAPPIRIEIVK